MNQNNTLMALVIAFVTIGCVDANRFRVNNNPTSRSIQILNRANVRFEVNWINPQNQDRMKNTEDGLHAGGDTVINSYVGHEFEVEELPHRRKKVCRGPDNTCRKAYFRVSKEEDQVITVTADFTVEHTDSRSRAVEQAKKVTNECAIPNLEGDVSLQLDRWTECVRGQVDASIAESKSEIDFQATLRNDMGGQLVEYACYDGDFKTTESIRNSTVTSDFQTKTRHPARFLLDKPAGKIVIVKNFINPHACRKFREHSYSDVTWEDLNQDEVFQDIYRRTFSSFREVVGLKQDINAFLSDKERTWMRSRPFLHIGSAPQGHGRRTLVKQDGRPSLRASMFIFCDVPDVGGAIHFPKLGVHINPIPGEALIVSHVDFSDLKERDSESEDLTGELVECPVLEGQAGGTILKIEIV